jgi:hypothetical protein
LTLLALTLLALWLTLLAEVPVTWRELAEAALL